MRAWKDIEARPLRVDELGERYRRYRLTDSSADDTMGRSLRHFGQASPVTACWQLQISAQTSPFALREPQRPDAVVSGSEADEVVGNREAGHEIIEAKHFRGERDRNLAEKFRQAPS